MYKAGAMPAGIMIGLLAMGCPEAGSDSAADGSPELVAYVNEDFGIRGLAPAGWQEYRSGHFRRSDRAEDPVRFIQTFFPTMTRDWLGWLVGVTVLPGQSELPESIGELRSEALTWSLHRVRTEIPDLGPIVLDMAAAETSEGVYAVGLVAGEADSERLREQVLMPPLRALEPSADGESGVGYEENRQLFDYDRSAPLDVEELATVTADAFTEITLSYASPMGGRVPATLLVPDGEGPFAGIILLHGATSSREAYLDRARPYAAAGAVVVLVDGPQHRPQPRSGSVMTMTEQDRDGQIQLIIDLRRAIDLLAARPDVDPERMAYVGYSYGAAIGGLVAGVEDRLRAYALMVGDGGLVEHMTGIEDERNGGPFFTLPPQRQEAWRQAMWPIEPLHYVGRAAPASLLFQAAVGDEMVPLPDAVRYQRAGSEPKRILWYDGGHILPDAAWEDQARWLLPLLGIDDAQ